MSAPAQSEVMAVVERMHAAMNAHDLDAFVACFAASFDSRQPGHPNRNFVGNEQVRKNWTGMFGGVPDFQADLVRSAVSGDTVWIQWRWFGTKRDGGPFEMAGVMILGVADGLFTWAQFVMEPVEQSGAGIEASVKGFVGGKG